MNSNKKPTASDKSLTGKKAPMFCLPDQNNNNICLKDIVSKMQDNDKLLIFFYPKDMTPGCTTEAVELSQNARKFRNAGVKILGISKLNPSSKQRFIDKNNLKIDLLSDEDLKVSQKYGVLKEKNMYGKKYMGISRESFLIDKNGNIIKHFTSVKPAQHAEEILNYLKSLT